MRDGGFLGKLLEHAILEKLKSGGLESKSTTRGSDYDIEYKLSDMAKSGNIEVRVITNASGMNLQPSSTQGAGRKTDPIKTNAKIAGSDFYIFADIRKILSGQSDSYSVYLVSSSYLEDLFKSGTLGKDGRTKAGDKINNILNQEVKPEDKFKNIAKIDKTIQTAKKGLENPALPDEDKQKLMKKIEDLQAYSTRVKSTLNEDVDILLFDFIWS
jgi:hypothetical protein